MVRFAVFPVALLALASFHSSIEPLSKRTEARLQNGGFWHKGCPAALSDLRLLTVSHWDMRGRVRTGRLVVNKAAAPKLELAFRRLHELHFPIRHMRFADYYGPARGRPQSGDVTASFHCRQAVPSPCTGGRGTGSWSNHAYGLAVDINPVENPYVGCGQSRDPRTRPYFDRSRHRPGMVTRKAVQAFASVGWGWGGAWTGNTRDYMHFSVNGH